MVISPVFTSLLAFILLSSGHVSTPYVFRIVFEIRSPSSWMFTITLYLLFRIYTVPPKYSHLRQNPPGSSIGLLYSFQEFFVPALINTRGN